MDNKPKIWYSIKKSRSDVISLTSKPSLQSNKTRKNAIFYTKSWIAFELLKLQFQANHLFRLEIEFLALDSVRHSRNKWKKRLILLTAEYKKKNHQIGTKTHKQVTKKSDNKMLIYRFRYKSGRRWICRMWNWFRYRNCATERPRPIYSMVFTLYGSTGV